MERSKYIDVHSITYKSSERDKLVTHILKVTLEVVTATTFVMLDRLFYEALDVVRQHAAAGLPGDATRDLEIQVHGQILIRFFLFVRLFHYRRGTLASSH